MSFSSFEQGREPAAAPADVASAVVGIGVASGHGAGRGAQPRLFRPLDGAFNGPMAAAITRWKDE